MNNEYIQKSDNEINLKELFLVLWSKKILIISITTIAAITSVSYSLSLPNIYTSNALLAPTTSEDSLANKLGGYSSIAGIAGINLQGNSGGKATEAIERIKSYDFFVNYFIPNIEFENLVAAKSWTSSNNTIVYDNKIFKKINNQWVRKAKYPIQSKPSYQEAYEIYNKILLISEDRKTSFISMSIEHPSPNIAKKWLNLIIYNINNHMRELDKAVAKNSIDFLTVSAQNTNLSQIKAAITKLIEGQIQILTLAEVSKNYVFKPIASPIAPEKKSKPSRAIICILGTFIGLFIGVILSLMMHFFNLKKR
jgi:LPS O-antigen subunit length determinant protein (WzzB/FepE family)